MVSAQLSAVLGFTRSLAPLSTEPRKNSRTSAPCNAAREAWVICPTFSARLICASSCFDVGRGNARRADDGGNQRRGRDRSLVLRATQARDGD